MKNKYLLLLIIVVVVVILIFVIFEGVIAGIGFKIDESVGDVPSYSSLSYSPVYGTNLIDEYFQKEIEMMLIQIRIIEFTLYHGFPMTGLPVMERVNISEFIGIVEAEYE